MLGEWGKRLNQDKKESQCINLPFKSLYLLSRFELVSTFSFATSFFEKYIFIFCLQLGWGHDKVVTEEKGIENENTFCFDFNRMRLRLFVFVTSSLSKMLPDNGLFCQ